ncbi:hypothetical protein L2E82_15406 [Cichorium intybus]|uniref:Uncharacterized protein n=1 Tax=Cichorium intybus TaxID=13427 RepID=A0ACB9F396_CICIN|nr:hypothetical protein L2E82_15406 [Cichorium intybus]
MEEPTLSNEKDTAQREGETSSESDDKAFVVDQELDDSDGDQECGTQIGKEKLVACGARVNEGVEEGLQDVVVEQTLRDDGNAANLLESGYSKDEVLHVLQESPFPLEVAVMTPAEEENPITHSPDMVPETQQNFEIDKGIEETQPSKQLLKKRKKSERILKRKLSQQIGSTGASSGDPLTID